MSEKGKVTGVSTFVSHYKKMWGSEPLSTVRQTHVRVRGMVPTVSDMQMYLGLGQSNYGEYASITFRVPKPAQQHVFNEIQRLYERCSHVDTTNTGERRIQRHVVLWGLHRDGVGRVFVRARVTRRNRVSSVYFGNIASEGYIGFPVAEALTST